MNKTETARAATGMIVGVMIVSYFGSIGMLELPEDYDTTTLEHPPTFNFLPGIIILIEVAILTLLILYIYSRPEKEKDLNKNELS